jgi:hypothetical protein
MGLKIIASKSSSMVITSPPNIMKIYKAVPKLSVEDTRRTGDLISLLSFLENKLKINTNS